MQTFYRRQFLKLAAKTALYSAVYPVLWLPSRAVAKNGLLLTPAQSEGPFYPLNKQANTDPDLSKLTSTSVSAQGKPIHIVGRVTDSDGSIIENAQVEIWQANAVGRYNHIRDRNKALIDPDFQGWGIDRSSSSGEYQFTTIIPGVYPAAADWFRPPHIHFKVLKTGYKNLTTQMYFPKHELNKSDLILNSLSNRQLRLLIAKKTSETGIVSSNEREIPVYEFNIVLAKS